MIFDYKINDIIICKKDYTYNGEFKKDDEFVVIGFNDYNVRLKTKLDTYHIIRYYSKLDAADYDPWFYDLFYTKQEFREKKLKRVLK